MITEFAIPPYLVLQNIGNCIQVHSTNISFDQASDQKESSIMSVRRRYGEEWNLSRER